MKRATQFLTALGPIAFFVSCVQGPDYQRPGLTGLLSPGFKNGSAPDERSSRRSAPVPDEWWRQFGESKLTALVSQALSANQDLAQARARVETARTLVGSKRADWFPQLNSVSSLGTQRQSASAFGANLPAQFGDVSSLLKRDFFRSSVEMRYDVDLWGKVKRGVEAAQATLRSAEDTLAAQRLLIAAETARHYFLLRSLDAQSGILAETIALRQEGVTLETSRFQGGLAGEVDLTRARTELELARADLEVITRQRGSTEHALAVLCGQSPSSFAVAKQAQLPEPPTFRSSVPSALLQSRPDIAAEEGRLQAACAEIGVAKAEFFPSFSLVGSGGLDSVSAKDFLKWENRALSLGPSVTLPIFTGGKLKANLSAAKSRYDEALARYQQTILGAFRDVEDALLDLQSLQRQRVALNAAATSAKETAQLARVRHEKGLASYFEVVEADRTVLSIRLRLAQIEGDRLISSVLLAKALGGGWKERSGIIEP